MKLILLYAGAMVFMTGVAVVLVGVVIAPKMSAPTVMTAQGTTALPADVSSPEGLAQHIVPLGEFIVNPSGTNGLRYLNVNMSADVDSNHTASLIQNHQPELQHVVNRVISEKTIDELEKPGGMEQLGEDVRDALNELFGEGRIRKIYFTQFIIQ